ncbi:MAG: dethiobiotin synthase [Chthoniobacterales bacterium]|nr:dethiobiotin synthase [Chthoniobacterales bacterium]
MNYFITGTDTDCGKTFVTALLVRAAREAGIDAVGAKPFCCGPRDDAEILAAASGNTEPLDALNPVWFQTPAAPMACELLGEKPSDYGSVVPAMRELAARHGQIFCEGAGGWLVPLRKGFTMADFAVELGWPVIVVVRNKLGALNHALLTVENVRSKGLPLAGFILNNADGLSDAAARTNRIILEECVGRPLLAEVGPREDRIDLPRSLL